MRNAIILEFVLHPGIEMNALDSKQLRMVKWCKARKMEMAVVDTIYDFTKVVRVRFYRDQTTMDFIKEFLELPVGHALPYESLKTIPNVKVL